MTLRAFITAGFLVLATTLPAWAEGFIHARGRDLIAPDGNVFLIRGIALGNWLMPEGYLFKFKKAKAPREIHQLMELLLGPDDAWAFWSDFRDRWVAEDDIRLIAKAGFNTIRVPLHYGLFLAQNDRLGSDSNQPIRFEGPGWALLDRLVGWCRQAGLRVIIDLHAAPGGQTGVNHDDGTGFPLVFYLPREKARTTALWREIARRYGADPTVLGYELLNEPISTYNDEDLLNSGLEPLYRELTQAVREVAPTSWCSWPPPNGTRIWGRSARPSPPIWSMFITSSGPPPGWTPSRITSTSPG